MCEGLAQLEVLLREKGSQEVLRRLLKGGVGIPVTQFGARWLRSRELAEICVCAGLASNLAAMRALATEGIQRGHMGLHARQIAMAAGAHGNEIDQVAQRMVAEKQIKPARAEALLAELRIIPTQN